MEPRNPAPMGDSKPKPPKWSSPLWYLPVMILVLWFWQSTVSQFSYQTIPYSEFKSYLAKHEVVRCVIREDDIQGEILPKAPPSPQENPQAVTNRTAKASTNEPKPILFRTVRIEDPKLVDELETAGV